MKIYSEITKKLYDSERECLKAEAEVKAAEEKKKAEQKKLADERKTRANEVETARNAANDAIKHYYETLSAFNKDYGPFHTSFTSGDFKGLFDFFLNF